MGAERPRHGPPVAGALGRARRAARSRQATRAGAASLLDGHERLRLGRRADPGAELGAAGPRGLAVRHRPDASPRSASRTAARPAPPRRSRGRRRRSCGSPPSIAAKRNVVLPAVTISRYVAHTQATTPLTVTAPPTTPHSPARRSPSPARPRREHASTSSATNTDANSATTVRLGDRRRRRLLQYHRRGHGRHERPQHRRRQPERRHRAREADRLPRLRARAR